ncbi:MAG: alpha-galactosidase [Clostridium sp.]|uniref:glycoside hydrolase family 36 protein n=1 Tax=Clostridium sp. TaxID=1506 RepID=UPI00290C01F4|nr:alpha-galactosidase [Clostridium sp.]MDU5109945.1 alpha-galactosidase [Clostridium sp.]
MKKILINIVNEKVEIIKSDKKIISGVNLNRIHIDNRAENTFEIKSINKENIKHEILGEGEKTTIIWETNSSRRALEKIEEYEIYDKYPITLFLKVKYKNNSEDTVSITKWSNYNLSINSNNDEVPFYSYQGASYEDRPDWINPLNQGYEQDNFMGMNSSDYGGGTPVVDIWTKNYGILLGHIGLTQKEVSLPIQVLEDKAILKFESNEKIDLKENEIFETYPSIITIHEGDCFNGLKTYRDIMIDLGVKFDDYVDEAYEATWCAWGYERNFNLEQIYGAIPKVKELGLKWVCLDDGYQLEEGDLELDPRKFPNGDIDMRNFVDHIHNEGLKAQLWWVPLAVDPKSKLYKDHPEWLLKDKEGKEQLITWWDCYYLCPAYKEVQDDIERQLRKILIDWNYDGIKIDGQHLNSSARCYNTHHNHKNSYESVEWMTLIMKKIYDVARELKKEVTIMYCPCGTTYSLYTMPYYNVPVASDPESSYQVRSKGKVFKALMSERAPYHGDHVELSDGFDDFASTVGIGGVIGTKFTWPLGSMVDSQLRPGEEDPFGLNSKKEEKYRKWIKLYNEKMLSKGIYRGDLYDIGYDYPEAYVIEKDNSMYYSFYEKEYNGKLEFRGLEKDKEYEIYDYVNDIKLGKVTNKRRELEVSFKDNILVQAIEIK